jgi:hypothetical protein
VDRGAHQAARLGVREADEVPRQRADRGLRRLDPALASLAPALGLLADQGLELRMRGQVQRQALADAAELARHLDVGAGDEQRVRRAAGAGADLAQLAQDQPVAQVAREVEQQEQAGLRHRHHMRQHLRGLHARAHQRGAVEARQPGGQRPAEHGPAAARPEDAGTGPPAASCPASRRRSTGCRCPPGLPDRRDRASPGSHGAPAHGRARRLWGQRARGKGRARHGLKSPAQPIVVRKSARLWHYPATHRYPGGTRYDS